MSKRRKLTLDEVLRAIHVMEDADEVIERVSALSDEEIERDLRDAGFDVEVREWR